MSDFSQTDFGYDHCLALFDKPLINTGIVSHKWIQHRPISQISNTGVLEFTIPGTSSSYINLQCSFLQIQGKIVKEDGGKITPSEDVGFINMPLQTLWRQVDLSLQQQIINSKVGPNYAYKSYIDALTNYSTPQKKGQLSSQLFSLDSAGEMDNPISNTGYFVRRKRTKDGYVVQLNGGLFLDICEQDRLILNGVEINLKFWPNKPAFYLMSTIKNERFEFVITDAYFNACMVEVSPAIVVGHSAALADYSALYPISQSDIKSFSIGKGLYDFTVDNIFSGDIPSSVIIGLVPSEGYNGSYKRNPLNFHHFNCNFCGFYINGESAPGEPFQPNYPEDDEIDAETGEIIKNNRLNYENVSFNESYLSLFGQNYSSNDTIGINWEDYPNGFCLYKFDFLEKKKEVDEDGVISSLPRRGHTRLILKFKHALKESVNVIIYARFPRIMKIDQARNIIF
jgi:hypothetical protein